MTASEYQELSADNLITKVTSTPSGPDLETNQHTDHMVEVDWDLTLGWGTPYLKPFAPLELAPTSSVLHYAVTCFEGMKAYKSENGEKVRMFRPRDNIARLNDSAERICLPKVNPDAALTLLEKFLELEHKFIKPGHYIYLRPLLMGTDPNLGVKASSKAKFMIMATLMPVLNSSPLRLYCSPPNAIRAWPGGFGYAKLGANYGPSLKANQDCLAAGYSQVLWLLGEEGVVTEAGASNLFVAMKNKETGKTEVLTCSLSTGVILPGITRKSVLQVLGEKFTDATVEERTFTIKDIEQAAEEGRLVEAFAVGTAYFVAPVEAIRTPEGKVVQLSTDSNDMYGEYSGYAKKYLGDIMWGRVDHEWGHDVAI